MAVKFWHMSLRFWFFRSKLSNYYCMYVRRPVPSTDQAIPSCFYFRISWILMEQRCFYFFCTLGFLEGLKSLKHWLLRKLSMKNLDQKFKFLIKNRYFGALIFQKIWFFKHLIYNFKTSWPQKISIFKKDFNVKITLILMIKKRPLPFSKLKK